MSAPWTWLANVRSIPRADWPAPSTLHLHGGIAALHRAPQWVLWADDRVTSTAGVSPEVASVRPLTADAEALIDAVWHGEGHRGFGDWARLARVERIAERELLGVRWPRPWEERLERLLVEMVDGTPEALFVHTACGSDRPSGYCVTLSRNAPEGFAVPLDRPEPVVLYSLEPDAFGAPKLTRSQPRYLAVRPRARGARDARGAGSAGCVTAFVPKPGGSGWNRRDHASLPEAMRAHRLEAIWVRPMWHALHDVALGQVAAIEAARWSVGDLAVRETPAGVVLDHGGEAYGPCGTPWDVASILAALAQRAGTVVPKRSRPVRRRARPPAPRRAASA